MPLAADLVTATWLPSAVIAEKACELRRHSFLIPLPPASDVLSGKDFS